MRIPLIIACIGVFVSAPAFAGTISIENGKVNWTSTECTAPLPPPSILEADRHSAASTINALVIEYNAYVSATKLYMECLSAEAEKDANVTSVAIVDAAKLQIDAKHKSVSDMGAALQKHAE